MLAGGDRSLQGEVSHFRALAQVGNEAGGPVLQIQVDGDGVSLSVEESVVGVRIDCEHLVVFAVVDVGLQHHVHRGVLLRQ